MARNYANVSTAIWQRDGDFVKLSVHAQWAYLMLLSQPDISAAGVLSINLRRWTGRAADVTRDVLVAALKELAEARFVVYDQDTEELLVRTFVKWDGGYTNRKRKPVIVSAAREIESPLIRRVLAAELNKLGFIVAGLTNAVSDAVPDSLSRSADSPSDGLIHEGSMGSPEQPPFDPPKSGGRRKYPQENRLSGRQSRFDRVVVTEVVPLTTTPNPQPTTPPPSSGGAGGSATGKRPRADRGTRLPADWQPTTDLLAWFHGKKVGNAKLADLVNLEVETEKFRNFWHAKSGKDATKVDWGATWRNWMLNAESRYGSRPAASVNGRTTGQNRHVDDLPPAQRNNRNPFSGAVRSSQAGGRS